MLRDRDAREGAFRIYRGGFRPRKQLADGSCVLHFTALRGRAEIWLDGCLIGTKEGNGAGALRVPLPTGAGGRQLSVLVEGRAGEQAGVGRVLIEPESR